MTKALCIRYTIVMIVMAVITAALAFLLEQFFGMQWPSGVNIAIIFLTAMITGMYCFEKLNVTPEKSAMWKLAAYFTIIQFAMAVIIMMVLIQVEPTISDLVGQLSGTIWLALILFATLMILLLNRFGFSFGISQAKKLASVKKAKE